MATVDLTLDQLIEAVRQLAGSQRERLLREIENLPSPDQARAAARRLRGTFRMNPQQRKRMAELLFKGNSGTLAAEESDELDRLVDEFERRTLDMARAVASTHSTTAPSRSVRRPRSD